MKSAYEKALERLERESGPTRALTEEQKARIAEIDRRYDAQAAEHKLTFESKAFQAGSAAELDALRADFANEIAAIEARREKDKQAVWDEVG